MKAQEIAAAVGARVVGDANAEVRNARSVASADEHSLVFVENAKCLTEAIESRAAVLVAGELAAENSGSKTILVSAQPKLAFARAAALLHPKILIDTGVHQSAVVHPSEKLAAGVSVCPNSVVEA